VWLPWLIAATCVVAWAVALGFWFRTDPQRPQLVQFPITATAMAEPFFLSVSPDGNQIVYPVTTAAGTVLWIRRLDSPDARVLQGTEGGAVSDWSPDSRFIVFASGGHLKKIDVNGGPPQTLTTHRSPFRRSTWSRNGVILFTDGPIIRRIADTGGEASNVTELDPSRNETAHSTPWFLPDGRHFFYTAWSDNPEDRAIYVGSLDSKERIRLLSADSKAIYSPPGLILFRRERQLMVQHFDPNLLQLRGDAVPIVSSISFSPDLGQSAFHVSERALVYVADTTSGLNLMWFDRAGTMSEPRRVVPGLNPALSPDDRRVAFYAGAGTTNVDIWTYDFDRDLIERLTTDPDGDAFPLFSPDGQRLVFASNRDNPTMVGLYEKPSNGAAAEQNILPPVTRVMMPRDWTDGGEQLILETGLRFTDPRDILVLSRGSNSKPVPYAATSYDERHPALSPDNKWLAYTTNESDTYQIVVQAFPDPTDGKVPVGPGRFPRWKAKGGELYYINADGWLVAATVRTTPTFEVLRTTPLFSAPFNPQLTDLNIPYDVTADGKRFLMSVPVTPLANPRETVINVVLGWQALLPNGFNSD
jgi:Tol biopolymer transport system component